MRTSDQILDELLVLRSQDGDAKAIDELVCRWHPRLLRHAWHLTRQHEAAADVTQESWLAIVRGIGRLHDPSVFRSWAYRIVTHKCADWTRWRQDNRLTERCVEDVADVQTPSIEMRDEAQQVHDAMRRLGADQRAILSLRYWEAMTTAEMAAVLDVPEGTVKSRLNHARNDLKYLLERTII